MIELPNVTLCCVDTKHHRLAARSLRRSMRDVRFGRVVFLTDELPPDTSLPPHVEVQRIGNLGSREAYSEFMLKRLLQHIDSQFALVTQWDGYVVHADLWDPSFLSCDYLGAKWPESREPFMVGNGGFSLRSRKLLLALQDERVELSGNEDQVICGQPIRQMLEGEYGIRFGPTEMADRFSFETDHSIPRSGRRTFGFHGLFNFFFVEPQAELVGLASELTDDVALSEFCLFLLRNCFNFKQWEAAAALGDRILQCDPNQTEVSDIVAKSQAMRRPEVVPKPTLANKLALRLLQRMLGSK